MPPLLLRRRPAPAPLPPPRAHSLSETGSEILSPRSPSDTDSPPPQSLQREARHAGVPLPPPSRTTTTTRGELNPAGAIAAATSRIQARQDAQTPTTIPGGYGGTGTGLDSGTIVGITLGSVGGFVLMLWLLYWCINLGRAPVDLDATSSVSVGAAGSVLRRGSRHRSSGGGGHRRHHRHRSPRETIEIRTSRRPYIVGDGGGVREVLVEETTRGVSRGPPPVVPPPPRVVDDDDEVVVIEENSSPPRRHRSSRRSSSRRDSSYRDDPRVRRSGGSRR